MRITRVFGMMALVCLLAVQLAGCASGTKISSKRLCEGAGGTYALGTCTSAKTMKAVEMCQANSGTYNYGDDTCELPSDATSK